MHVYAFVYILRDYASDFFVHGYLYVFLWIACGVFVFTCLLACLCEGVFRRDFGISEVKQK